MCVLRVHIFMCASFNYFSHWPLVEFRCSTFFNTYRGFVVHWELLVLVIKILNVDIPARSKIKFTAFVLIRSICLQTPVKIFHYRITEFCESFQNPRQM